MSEVVRAVDVKHIYPDGTSLCYRGIPFVVNEGEKVVLLGPNGSGKTTLLFHLLGLLKPNEGTISVFGHDPAEDFEHISERIGLVLQNPDDQIIAPTVRDDIAFSPINHGHPPKEVAAWVDEIAAEIGITHLLNKVPQYLSGGERLKVALAGALVLRPELLILDEPFEGLDTSSKLELANRINRRSREHNMAAIVATHELNLVPYFADTVYLLARGGEISAKGTARDILTNADLLLSHDIEPPVISVLFDRLRQHNVNLDRPLTVEDALKQLLPHLQAPGSSPSEPYREPPPGDIFYQPDQPSGSENE